MFTGYNVRTYARIVFTQQEINFSVPWDSSQPVSVVDVCMYVCMYVCMRLGLPLGVPSGPSAPPPPPEIVLPYSSLCGDSIWLIVWHPGTSLYLLAALRPPPPSLVHS